MKKWLIIGCLFLWGCGIPDSSSFETLLAPFLLDDRGTPGVPGGYPQCTRNNSTGGIIIELKAMVYNTESSFSGYDIYYQPSFSTLTDLKTSLTNAVSSHIRSISSSSKEFASNIEDTYIIKGNGNLPTVPAGSASIAGYNIQPTTVILKIDRDPSNNYLTPAQYGFTITSVSLPNIVESEVGNVIAIDGTQATTTPSYCGMS